MHKGEPAISNPDYSWFYMVRSLHDIDQSVYSSRRGGLSFETGPHLNIKGPPYPEKVLHTQTIMV